MRICYNNRGYYALKGVPLTADGAIPLFWKGVMEMVTYTDLFALGVLIVAIISLVLDCANRNK